MKKKIVFGVMVVFFLVAGFSVLYAQNSPRLEAGVYQFSNGGRGMIVIRGVGNSRDVVVRNNDGEIAMRGTIRIIGTRINFSASTGEFEVWTILAEDSFSTSEGVIWFKVRNWKDSDLR